MADNPYSGTSGILPDNAQMERVASALETLASRPLGPDGLQDSAVTTAKIASAAVTSDKIADNAVTANKIPDDNIPISKLSNLPLSAQNQLYAHYIYIANTDSAADRLYLRGQISFINSTNTPANDYAALEKMVTGRASVSALWREATDVSSDGKQMTKIACRVSRYRPQGDITIGGVCIELGSLAWRELSLNSADISFKDTVIPVGSNAG